MQRLGVSVVAQTDAGFDAAKQKSDVETILAKKPSAILALPLDPVTSAEALKPAVASGVKIVLLSNKPKGFVQGKDYVTIVTDDLFQMGKHAADAMAEAIGKKGKVAWIYHDAAYYVTNQRDNAFKSSIESDYPDIQIVAKAGIADPARAEDIAHALLLKNPDLDGIYVTWAEPAEGVLAALRAAGNTKTKIVTLDLSEPIALDMVKGGNVAAIVADKAYELGRAMADGRGLRAPRQAGARVRVAPVLTVTKSNVAAGLEGVAAPRRAAIGARRGQIGPNGHGRRRSTDASRARGARLGPALAALGRREAQPFRHLRRLPLDLRRLRRSSCAMTGSRRRPICSTSCSRPRPSRSWRSA